MDKKEGDLIYGFFRERFGGLVAEELVEIYLKKLNINNFELLPLKEQIDVGQNIIESISKKFYSTDRIENLKTLYLLRFSLKKAAEKVESILNKKCDLSIKHPKSLIQTEIDPHLDLIKDEQCLTLGFEFVDTIKGFLMITLPKLESIELAKILMLSVEGSRAKNNELNDAKIAALTNFFNLLLPSFSDIISETFHEKINYSSISLDRFNEKFYHDGKFIIPSLMIYSKSNLHLHGLDCPCDVNLFINDASGRFKTLMNQSNVIYDPFDKAPPKLLIKQTGNVLSDVKLLFKMLNLEVSIIEDLLNLTHKKEFDKFTLVDFDHFYNNLMNKYISHFSENKINSIKFNLEKIIPVEK
jgi:chemotaxis protein CheY-P-specific phosphatase CheC